MRVDYRNELPDASRAMTEPHEVYDEVAHRFTPAEQVSLTLAIVPINRWNRLAVGFRQPVGALRSHRQPAAA
jgi:alkylhydroperoxidase family enzyme